MSVGRLKEIHELKQLWAVHYRDLTSHLGRNLLLEDAGMAEVGLFLDRQGQEQIPLHGRASLRLAGVPSTTL